MLKVDQYSSVQLEEYKGKWSLILGYEDRSGAFKPKFCKQEFGKGNEKTVPIRIPLGDSKEEAAAVLKTLFLEMSE